MGNQAADLVQFAQLEPLMIPKFHRTLRAIETKPRLSLIAFQGMDMRRRVIICIDGNANVPQGEPHWHDSV